MLMPNKEELRLYEQIKNGTDTEATQARKKLKELISNELAEEKKNPPKWGDIMF